ncbi:MULTISPECIES: collagen-like protein [Lysinibacillus]|uniref:collagen-like protein n=1 Tax=Lysinibacillus TaxID=400634 RepID=UPI00289BF49D|nr:MULTISPECIES: collagen-like protein [Lysinibacillus]MEA0565009.1 collagen-like protein [Lysinibacillus irui]
MGFDSFNRSEKGLTNKRISRIHDDCEENCNDEINLQGVQVPQQPLGTGLPGFAYIYDTTAQPAIPNNGQVTFNTNGNITPAGFVTHVPGTAPIIINQTGIYLITYELFVSGGPNAFALFNGDNQIAGSNYGDNAGNSTENGQVITPLNASDVLTLRNIYINPTALVNVTIGGIPVISASIVILRLA